MRWHREWFIRVPWGKLALVSRGHPDGEPVLLVHGRQDSLSIFEPLIEQMSEQYYYVALDMPGNGLSDAFPHVTNEPLPKGELNYAVVFDEAPKAGKPFIEANYYDQVLKYTRRYNEPGPKLQRFHFLYAMELALLHLGWDRFIFMGHSMGCEQGLFYNVVYPNQITRMILLDAGPTLMRMQIEDNAEYQHLFYDSYYENYHTENFKRKTYTRMSATQSLQRLRELSNEQCAHLLARNFHEFGHWFPIEAWHPSEIRVIFRKTFVVYFDVDDDDDEPTIQRGTHAMILWNLRKDDFLPKDEHLVLEQSPQDPLNIYAYGEKDAVVIRLTKNAAVETVENCDLNLIKEEIERHKQSPQERYLSSPFSITKNLGTAEQIYYLRSTPEMVKEVKEARSSVGTNEEQRSSGIPNETRGSNNKKTNENQNLNTSAQRRTNEAQGSSNEGHSSNKKPKLFKERSFYFLDFCVISSKVLDLVDFFERHCQAVARGLPPNLDLKCDDDATEENSEQIKDEHNSVEAENSYRRPVYPPISAILEELKEKEELDASKNSFLSSSESVMSKSQCPIAEGWLDEEARSDYTENSALGASTEATVGSVEKDSNYDGDAEDIESTPERVFRRLKARCISNMKARMAQYIKESSTGSESSNRPANAAQASCSHANEAQNENEQDVRIMYTTRRAQNLNRTKRARNGKRRQQKDELTDTDDESNDTDEKLTETDEESTDTDEENGRRRENRRGNRRGEGNDALNDLIQRMNDNNCEGYLSWDNRLKHLAPQNYGNEYYFELFKTIPPTLLIAASYGAKNVPPIPKWRQGAIELLEKLETLDNFHRVDVEGSHDVHYTHPERVLPFINAFLKDNKVYSKL